MHRDIGQLLRTCDSSCLSLKGDSYLRLSVSTSTDFLGVGVYLFWH